MVETKQFILDNSHLYRSSDMAREYFEDVGLKFENIKNEDYQELTIFIQKEIDKLLADKSYSMVGELRMHHKIRINKYGYFFYTNGSYFDEREAISFYNPKTNDKSITIGFCGWADGCNRIPFIKGFIEWCDYLITNSEETKE